MKEVLYLDPLPEWPVVILRIVSKVERQETFVRGCEPRRISYSCDTKCINVSAVPTVLAKLEIVSDYFSDWGHVKMFFGASAQEKSLLSRRYTPETTLPPGEGFQFLPPPMEKHWNRHHVRVECRCLEELYTYDATMNADVFWDLDVTVKLRRLGS